MLIALRTVWPLMLGYFFVMLGHGVHSTLLGVRAEAENFDPTITGFIISLYTLGLVLGTYICVRVIQQIGHIRAYAVASALTSAAALMYIISVTPLMWAISRVIIGFAMAILYTATESWLNDSAENHNRGSYLSLYLVVTNIGLGLGQFLLLLAAPESATLFLCISLLWSISVVPILFTVRNVPSVEAPKRMNVRELYRISPFGVVNMLLIGALFGATFSMAGLFAAQSDFTLFETSLFVSVMIFVPALSQTPLGQISDRVDRRIVILFAMVAGLIICLLTIVTPRENHYYTIGFIGVYSAFVIPMYGVTMAHVNDFLARDQMVGASSSLVRIFSVGTTLSPTIVGVMMQNFGTLGYYYFQGVTLLVAVLYSAYRLRARWGRVEHETDIKFTAMPSAQASSIASAMNPEAESEVMGYSYIEDEPVTNDDPVDGEVTQADAPQEPK